MSNPTQSPKPLPPAKNQDEDDGRFLTNFAHVYSNWIPKASDQQRLAAIGERLIAQSRDNQVTLSLNVDASALEQPGAKEGFAKWFEIQRKKSWDNKELSKTIVFYLDGEEVYRAENAQDLTEDRIAFVATRSGALSWRIEVNGVSVAIGEGGQRVWTGDPIVMTGFLRDLNIFEKATEKKAVPIPRGPDIPSDQDALDQADADDFNVPVAVVRKARKAYQEEMFRTRLFFMAEWNSVARFKKREYVRKAMVG